MCIRDSHHLARLIAKETTFEDEVVKSWSRHAVSPCKIGFLLRQNLKTSGDCIQVSDCIPFKSAKRIQFLHTASRLAVRAIRLEAIASRLEELSSFILPVFGILRSGLFWCLPRSMLRSSRHSKQNMYNMQFKKALKFEVFVALLGLSLIHIWRCRRS